MSNDKITPIRPFKMRDLKGLDGSNAVDFLIRCISDQAKQEGGEHYSVWPLALVLHELADPDMTPEDREKYKAKSEELARDMTEFEVRRAEQIVRDVLEKDQ